MIDEQITLGDVDAKHLCSFLLQSFCILNELPVDLLGSETTEMITKWA